MGNSDIIANLISKLFIEELQEFKIILQKLPYEFNFNQWKSELKKSGMFDDFSRKEAREVLYFLTENGMVNKINSNTYKINKGELS